MPNASPWVAFELKVPGKELLENVRGILETLVVFLDIAKTILETVKTFLIGIGNPIQALAMALYSLVTSFIESLNQTGLYYWQLLPDFATDPTLKRVSGGFPKFVDRWKGSLQDGQDFNRPRPVGGFNSSFYVLVVADFAGLPALLKAVQVLITFFGAETPKRPFLPPANLKVLPAAASGKSLFSPREIFASAKDIKGIAVEWSVQANIGTPDPAFSGLSTEFTEELEPEAWLVERTTKYPNDEVKEFTEVGKLVKACETDEVDFRSGKKILKKVNIMDDFGEPVVLMETTYLLYSKDIRQGFNKKFRFVDEFVNRDTPYYYRVRGFSGPLAYDANTQKIKFEPDNIKADSTRQYYYTLGWPSSNPKESVTMGQASALVPCMVPSAIEFDVEDVLRRILLAGFSFGFGLPLERKPKTVQETYTEVVDGQTLSKTRTVTVTDDTGYPVYLPAFDANGDPLPGFTVVDIGKGTLSAIAGSLAGYSPELPAQTPTDLVANDEVPWITDFVQAQVAKITNQYLTIIFQNPTFPNNLKNLMTRPLPYGPPETAFLLTNPVGRATNLLELVTALTYSFEEEFASGTSSVTTPEAVSGYIASFLDKPVRKNLQVAVKFITTLGYQGVPPDWMRLSVFQLIPWSTNILNEILAKIQAMVDAFNDLLKEIKDYIDMLIRKITALEQFIEFLIKILNLIESLSVGFYVLAAYDLRGGVDEWFSVLDSAEGEKPPSTAGNGYTAGVCLAAVAPTPIVVGIEMAIKAIF